MSTWEKLDNLSKNIAEEPWSLYWREMKSGTETFEHFLHEPLQHVADDFDEVDKSWTVQTQIIGHEIGLYAHAVCSIALVDPRRKTVFLTLYKHPRE
jgi:hypothetical protein